MDESYANWRQEILSTITILDECSVAFSSDPSCNTNATKTRNWFSLGRYLSTASTTVCPLLRGLRKEHLSTLRQPQPLAQEGLRRFSLSSLAKSQNATKTRNWFSLGKYLSTASTTVCPLLRGLRKEHLSTLRQPQPLAQEGLRRFSLSSLAKSHAFPVKKLKRITVNKFFIV